MIVSPSSAFKVVDVKVICVEALDPKLCSNVLNSKSGGAKDVDLVTLAQYTIDVARDNITNTINLIKSFIIKSGNDPEANAHYETCLMHFDDENETCVLSDIDYTQELLKKGRYGGVNIGATAVRIDVGDCIIGVTPDDPPYPDKSNIPQYADVILHVVKIILIISNYLTQK
ncbi:putative pectinesterase inhibitor domain-containing protein [Lupinus albus]|uniref:Putative pectinesterase inhibitor domain-containing protein n=1 Tax=Lupinus albus TaxID=3870 RepID=A0A6A4NY70_LUPAL|nr:putative pectinesterase inhibitor domain-containing protein [Lupinus albus]